MNRDMRASTVFLLRLEKTYYEQGFFNVKRSFDNLVRSGNGPITLQLAGGESILGHVNRRANRNGTARVMGRVPLRDWFHQNYAVGDAVPIAFEGPNLLSVGYPGSPQ